MAIEQLKYDFTVNKLSRFIKDPEDLQRTYEMLLKYYRPLRDFFFQQISNHKSYPTIDWNDFVLICKNWGIIDQNLVISDVDIIFVATNVEIEDQEGNDDRSLCRFEFYEIITRMANKKYLEKKIEPTIADSLERLLVEHILPMGYLKMDSQRWRWLFLWILPVDDILKANIDNL